MIISISGTPGAGKGTLAKNLAAELGWPVFSMGDLRRQAAARRGMTLAEYNKLGETDPETDLSVDRYQRELAATRDNFIIDGRTAWYFIPRSIKIFLRAKLPVGARHIWQSRQRGNQLRQQEDVVEDEAAVLKSVRERMDSDRRRYQKYWQIDVYDPAHYDLVIDTTTLTPEQVLDKARDFIAKRAKI